MSYVYFCVLDFEATCESPTNPNINEIIEFPSALYKLTGHSLEMISKFESFVKPKNNPILTKFCTELTTIQQSDVDNADNFPVVFKRYNKWLASIEQKEGVMFNVDNFVFVTCGNWDLQIMLPKDLNVWTINKVNKIWKQWINIKDIFSSYYNVRRPGGMIKMMEYLCVQHEGVHHRGIDDCVNTGKILQKMFYEGYQFDHKYIICLC